MNTFSIYESISNAASTYRRHFFLSLAVGATLGFVSWVGIVIPRSVSQALGIYKEIVIENVQSNVISKSDSIDIQVRGFIFNTGSAFAKKAIEYTKNTPLFHLMFVFIAWILPWIFSIYLYVVFLRLMIVLENKNCDRYITLFIGLPYFIRYLFASFLYMAFVVCIGIGFVYTGVALWKFILSLLGNVGLPNVLRIALFQIVSLVLSVTTLVAFCFYTTRYVFYGYCLVDKDCTVLESFSCSRIITTGVKLKLVPLSLVMLGLFYLYTQCIGLVTGYTGFYHKIDITIWSLAHNVFKGFAMPFGGYMLVYVYKRLAN